MSATDFSSTLFTWDVSAGKFVPQPINAYSQPSNTRPSARAYHNSVSNLGLIYVLNGMSATGEGNNDFWSYNTSSQQFSKIGLSATWTARYGATVVSGGGVLYVYGGYDSALKVALAEMVAIDVKAKSAVVTKDVAESIGLGQPRGAMVVSVEKDGPADKAGVEAGDIVLKVDGRAVDKSGDLPRFVGSIKPGQKGVLQVFRRGATKDLNITVVEFEADRPQRRAAAEPGNAAPAVKSALGLSVSDLNEAQKKELRLRGGVKVDAVDGAMKFIGFQPAAVARESNRVGETLRTVQLAKNVEGEIAGQWAQGMADGNAEKIAAAKDELAAWNKANPLAPIRITVQQVRARMKALKSTRAERTLKQTPKELRGLVSETLN